MNPLSIWKYYNRHKLHSLMLLGLSIVITVGLYVMVALVWGVYVEPGRVAYNSLTKFSRVIPETTAEGPDPAVLERLQDNANIAKIFETTFIRTELPGMVAGQGFQFDILGLNENDLQYLLDRIAASLKDGNLPQPGTAELVLSEDLAELLKLQVGDHYLVTSSVFFKGMDGVPDPTPFEVVGILDSDIKLGIVSLEFLNHHDQYRQLPVSFLLVPQDGYETAVEEFLRNEILTNSTQVMTNQLLSERIINEALPGLIMLLPLVIIVASAFSLVIVTVNQLENARRLPEFGVLHAVGHGKPWLVWRLTLETTLLALVGWLFGIGFAYLGLYLLEGIIFASMGQDLNYVAWVPIVFSLIIPICIAWITYLAVRRTLTRLDAVAIVERRELSTETSSGANAKKRPAGVNSNKPLAAATFFQRHRRRAVLLIGGMTLMILGIVLFIFALVVDADAKEPFLSYLNQVSIVRSPEFVQSLDPNFVARVRAHPAVERVIPVAPRYSMLRVIIPPFESIDASPYSVYADDMAYLVDLYALVVKDGRLPNPGTNEMVISETVAQNRNLKVGSVIGNPEKPAYPGAPVLESEFVISGIFARSKSPLDSSGLGFISLEYLESLDIYELPDVPPMIVVPRTGQKSLMDEWLENELAEKDAMVVTYDKEVSRIQTKAKQDAASIALLEAILAIVAATGLAVLSHVFTSQRSMEFGVLNALGYPRKFLVWRVLRETAFTTCIAWGLSAIVVMLGMILTRSVIFAPLGLSFDLFNITPWLYTLPIPVAVLSISIITIAMTLSRLDPVTIIEQRVY